MRLFYYFTDVTYIFALDTPYAVDNASVILRHTDGSLPLLHTTVMPFIVGAAVRTTTGEPDDSTVCSLSAVLFLAY